MNISRTGIIINTEKYEACVSFYKDLFGLKILFSQQEGDFKLTCFEFDGAYLMIETGGVAKSTEKTIEENATKLRFNVSDIDEALATVKKYGIDAEILHFDWGSTINIYDPDGNRVGIRDDSKFKTQIDTYDAVA